MDGRAEVDIGDSGGGRGREGTGVWDVDCSNIMRGNGRIGFAGWSGEGGRAVSLNRRMLGSRELGFRDHNDDCTCVC